LSAARNAALATIRYGTNADRGFVLDLGRRTTDVSVSSRRRAPEAAVRASYERLLEYVYDAPHVALIAEDGLAPLGFLLLMTEMPDEVTALPQAFVAYMAVEPHARRHRVAALLLEAAEREAKRRGLPHLTLMVTEENAAARELYAQAGFATERRLLSKPL